ncbi:MAG: DUF4082 domain-containing protein [Verrucomicrobiales bacterium]|nr:DUF4082 domain-containing protein [Verrucomicrobiales bacterium]
MNAFPLVPPSARDICYFRSPQWLHGFRRVATRVTFLPWCILTLSLIGVSAGAASYPLRYSLPEPGPVSLAVYAENGSMVRTVLAGDVRTAGSHTELWDGKDEAGAPVTDPERCRWKLLSPKPLTAEYLLSLGSSFPAGEGMQEHGVGNHWGPSSIAVHHDSVIVGAMGTEGAPGALRMTKDGARRIWSADAPASFLGRCALAIMDGWVFHLQQNYILGGHPIDQPNGPDRPVGRIPCSPSIPVGFRRDAAWPGDPIPGGDTQLADMDLAARLVAGERQLVLSYLNHHEIQWIDPVMEFDVADYSVPCLEVQPSVRILDRMSVPSPRSVAIDSDGSVLVLSETRLLRVSRTTRSIAVVVDHLESPHRLDVDPISREILVAERGSSQQIKRFSADGVLLATYGRLGGRLENGLYDPEAGFLDLDDIAADSDGSFWVVEGNTAPRRVAHFSAGGRLIREWYGGQPWNPFASADPDNPAVVWAESSRRPRGQHLMRLEVDYATRSWRVHSTYQVPMAYSPGVGINVWKVRKHEGVTFLVRDNQRNLSMAGGSLEILRVDETSWQLKPCVLANAGWPGDPHAEAGSILRSPHDGFIWTDANDDGIQQEGEFRRFPGFRKWFYEVSDPRIDAGFGIIYRDQVTRRVHRLLPRAWNTSGVPEYPDWPEAHSASFAAIPELATEGGGSPAIYGQAHLLSGGSDGSVYGAFPLGLRGFDSVEAVRLVRWDPEGKLRWVIGANRHQDQPPFIRVLSHARIDPPAPGYVITPRNNVGVVKDCVVVADFQGCLASDNPAALTYVWDRDGLWVGRLFDHPALTPGLSGMYCQTAGDNGAGEVRVDPATGDVLYLGGWANEVRVYRIKGWDDWVRREGTVEVDCNPAPRGVFRGEFPVWPDLPAGPGGREIGVRFQASEAGVLHGLRFWKAPAEIGNHRGKVWDDAGVQLAMGHFEQESESGWQTAQLVPPLSVEAGRTYRVSVNVNQFFVATLQAQEELGYGALSVPLPSAVERSGLRILQEPTYGYFSAIDTFPSSPGILSEGETLNALYFCDVLYAPGLAESCPSGITGTVDWVGDEVISTGTRFLANTTVTVSGGPGNEVVSQPLTRPPTGRFHIRPLLPSRGTEPPRGYNVSVALNVQRGDWFQYFRSPTLGLGLNAAVEVGVGETVDLGETFAFNPGFVVGALILRGPSPRLLGYPSPLQNSALVSGRDMQNRVFADGLDYRTFGGSDTGGAEARANFEGRYDSASDAFRGSYQLALAGLGGRPGTWERFGAWLTMRAGSADRPDEYVDHELVLTEYRNSGYGGRLTVASGETLTNHLRYCLSEVTLELEAAGRQLSRPTVQTLGQLHPSFGPDSSGEIRWYTAELRGVRGTVAAGGSRAQVVVYLPEGQYVLQPTAQAQLPDGAQETVQFAPVSLTVGCGQRLRFSSCLALEINEIATCQNRDGVVVSGQVRSGCNIPLRRIEWRVDGGARHVVCEDCAASRAFEFIVPWTGTCRERLLEVVATDQQGHSAQITRRLLPDATPPRILAPTNLVVQCEGPQGAVVHFPVSAEDDCGEVTLRIQPPSGSLLPPGDTEVVCIARDACGNESRTNFVVSVVGSCSLPSCSLGEIAQNGSFEEPGVPDGYVLLEEGAAFPSHWTVLAGGVEWFNPRVAPAAVSSGQAAAGNYLLDLAASPAGGGIRQSVATTPGQRLLLEFALGTSRERGRGGRATLTVSINGEEYPFEHSTSGSTIDWTSRSLSFTAPSSTTQIEFRTREADSANFVHLDNVRLRGNCLFLHCPEDRLVKASLAQGALVYYEVSAGNLFDPADVKLTCTPPPGSRFPVGTTLVHCRVEGSGQSLECSFSVVVARLEPKVLLSGKVVDSEGRPTAGVRVQLDGDAVGEALTGADGSYEVGPVPAGGTYQLIPSKLGHRFEPDHQVLSAVFIDERAEFRSVTPWRDWVLLNNAAIQQDVLGAPDQDTDGDGQPDLMEYAFGGDPFRKDELHPLSIRLEPDAHLGASPTPVLRFKPVEMATDLRFDLEYREEVDGQSPLGGWQGFPGPIRAINDPSTGAFSHYEVRMPEELRTRNLFLRLNLCRLADVCSPPAPRTFRSESLRIGAYNVQSMASLLVVPTLTSGCCEDIPDRVGKLAERIRATGYDIIAFSEAFISDIQTRLPDLLLADYPYQIRHIDQEVPGMDFDQDSGLMLLSRHPFAPFTELDGNASDYRPGGGNLVARAGAVGDWRDVAFVPFGEECENNENDDCWANKGCAYVRIRHRETGRPYNVLFTHLDAGHSVSDRWTRKHQLDTIEWHMRRFLGDKLNTETVIMMGDLNVVGSDGLPEYQQTFGPAGGFFRRVLRDTWQDQRYTGFPVASQVHRDPGLTQRTDGAGGPSERLDYVLLSNPPDDAGFRMTVQHVAVAYGLRWGEPYREAAFGLAGVTDLSDHLGIIADLNLEGPHSSPQTASNLPVHSLSGPTFDGAVVFNGRIAWPGGMHWFRLDTNGTFAIEVDSPSSETSGGDFRFHVYTEEDLSRPLLPLLGESRALRAVGESGTFPAQVFSLTQGRCFIRVWSEDPRRTGAFRLKLRHHQGQDLRDVVHLHPNRFPPPRISAAANPASSEVRWFKFFTERSVTRRPQLLHAYASNWFTTTLPSVELRRADLGVEATPADPRRPYFIEHRDLGGEPRYLRVEIPPHLEALELYVGWDTDLTTLSPNPNGSVSAQVMSMHCATQTDGDSFGGDDDDLVFRISVPDDGLFRRILRLGPLLDEWDEGQTLSMEAMVPNISFLPDEPLHLELIENDVAFYSTSVLDFDSNPATGHYESETANRNDFQFLTGVVEPLARNRRSRVDATKLFVNGVIPPDDPVLNHFFRFPQYRFQYHLSHGHPPNEAYRSR